MTVDGIGETLQEEGAALPGSGVFLLILFCFILLAFIMCLNSGWCELLVNLSHTEFQLYLQGSSPSETPRYLQVQISQSAATRTLKNYFLFLDHVAVFHQLASAQIRWINSGLGPPRELLHNPFGYNHNFSNET